MHRDVEAIGTALVGALASLKGVIAESARVDHAEEKLLQDKRGKLRRVNC